MTIAAFARASTSVALCLSPLSAAALTPQEAWDTWRSVSEESGFSITTGSEENAGGTLTVSDVAFAAEVGGGQGEGQGTLSGTIGALVFSDAGDGKVNVTMSESIPMTVAGTDVDGVAYNVAMTMNAPGLVYTAAEREGGGTDGAFEASEIAVSIDSVTEDGTPIDVTGTITSSDVSGSYSVSDSEPIDISNDFSAASFAMNLSGRDIDDEEGTFDMAMSVEDIAYSTSGTGNPMLAMSGDYEEMIASGYSTSGEGRVGPVSMSVTGQDPSESFDIGLTMDGGTGAANFGPDGLSYDVSYDGISFALSGSEIPIPQITGGLGAWQTKLEVPVLPSEEAEPIALRIGLLDVVVGEEIWGMIDPSGALPRDPATLVLDLVGQARLLASLLDEEAMISGEAPAELESLDINELRLSAVGAELTGVGAFVADYAAASPFGEGLPAVDGSINLTLRGSQALLERLVGMGLVTQDQAMMSRMMTGMLAKPGAGPDELVSEITIRPDGSILANGAPLPF